MRKSILTEQFGNYVAEDVKQLLTSRSNTFIGIGRSISSGGETIEDAIYTTVYRNQLYQNLVALKKIQPSDIQLVIPRIDWTYDKLYDAYDDMVELYGYNDLKLLGTVDANANTVLQGTVNVAFNVVTGYGTTFTETLFAGDQIKVNNEIKTIVCVGNSDYLVVNTNFAHQNTYGTITLVQNSNLVVANTARFTGNLLAGDIIVIGEETKEVVAVRSDKLLVVNTSLALSNTGIEIRKDDNTFAQFANTFYVRNSRDQIFKCLYNNGFANSTIEPTIDIDGQLPENPFILTADGYKWKYMYTIPPGLKQKFFNKNWMPVITDDTVSGAAVDGRIDIINVLWGGSGYISGGNNNTAPILSITNTDGSSANLQAKISNGVIQSVTILSGGNNYTYGTVTVTDAFKLGNTTLTGTVNVSGTTVSGNLANTTYFLGNVYTNDIITINGESRNVVTVISNTSLTVNSAFNYSVSDGIGLIVRSPAQFDISFSPKGGHGSSSESELGARDIMICTELTEKENETLPITDASNQYHFNQISLISQPLVANGAWTANAYNYRASTRLLVSNPGTNINFEDDEIVYIGTQLSTATMVARVVHWDADTNYLYINNITGPLTVSSIIKSVNSHAVTPILGISYPEIKPYSGDVLYIENRKNVVRNINQIEQVKIILTF